MKAVGYIRVSTSEQKLHGYSLDAQRELLERYAGDHDMELTGIYADEGISASKALNRRKGILQLLDDAEQGKFDVILFKDLTRWSRNASQFYAVQDRLEKAHVSWVAVEQPNLETVTASGKLIVGIHISVAAHESAQTSERIRFVNQSRAAKGFSIVGNHSVPIGLMVQDKHIVHRPEQEQMVMDIFETFERTQVMAACVKMLRDKYNYKIHPDRITKLLRNPLYKGEYRGVENYCEPYIDAERWERIERATHVRDYRPPTGRVYLFTGLLVCKECGRKMQICLSRENPYYGCPSHGAGYCEHKRTILESRIEQFLLETVRPTLNRYEVTAKPKTKKSPAPIRQKLNRLRELYIDGDVSKEEYTQRKEALEAELASLDAPTSSRIVLAGDWEQVYQQAPKQARKAAWRSIIDHIEVDAENNMEIFFLQ